MLKRTPATIILMLGAASLAQAAAPSISAAETLLTYGDPGRITTYETVARADATHDKMTKEKELTDRNVGDWLLRQLTSTDGHISAP